MKSAKFLVPVCETILGVPCLYIEKQHSCFPRKYLPVGSKTVSQLNCLLINFNDLLIKIYSKTLALPCSLTFDLTEHFGGLIFFL